MARVLILGSGGRLGAALAEKYSSEHEVIRLNRHDLDLSDATNIRKILGAQNFDVAVNCAALTNVDYCETHREEAFSINARSVGVIAEVCREKSARLLHVSTDYVFSGEREEGYSETDAAEPVSIYGESKLAGEEAALAASASNLVIRVSWVFGPHRPSFIEMMLKRALTDDTISAIGDKYSTPSYTLDLADMLQPYLSEIPTGGILHLSNGGSCSWRDYAQHALDVAHQIGLPMKALTVDSIPLDSLTAFVARRPRHTVMQTDRFTTETGKHPRSWQDAVTEYVTQFGETIIGDQTKR